MSEAVLVVDDDPFIRRLITTTLEDVGQYELHEAANGTTIVMLTATHGDDVERRAEQAGADIFLTKPFSPLELLRIVAGLNGRA